MLEMFIFLSVLQQNSMDYLLLNQTSTVEMSLSCLVRFLSTGSPPALPIFIPFGAFAGRFITFFGLGDATGLEQTPLEEEAAAAGRFIGGISNNRGYQNLRKLEY